MVLREIKVRKEIKEQKERQEIKNIRADYLRAKLRELEENE